MTTAILRRTRTRTDSSKPWPKDIITASLQDGYEDAGNLKRFAPCCLAAHKDDAWRASDAVIGNAGPFKLSGEGTDGDTVEWHEFTVDTTQVPGWSSDVDAVVELFKASKQAAVAGLDSTHTTAAELMADWRVWLFNYTSTGFELSFTISYPS